MSMTRMVFVAIGVAAAGVIGILLFTELWYRIGLGATMAVIVALLLYIGWRKDKKDAEAREELESMV
jgi:membrane protein implicated in regulation of membrane protease activity